jgi:CBS domain-containing protein
MTRMFPLPHATRTFDPYIDVLMTPRPITIAPTQLVEAAAAMMKSCRVRHLPVMEGAALVGVLSLRDVVAAPDRAFVADIMNRKPETVPPTTPLTVACERMLVRHISCLPVVEEPRLAGIFTATDALGFAITALEGERRDFGREATAAQLMTARPLVIVTPAETLATAWSKMRSARVRHLPVMQADSIVGLLSDRDLLAAGREWIGENAALARRVMLVADAMSTRLSTIAVDGSALEAARTLLRRRVGALPVLHGTELRGMLTVSDFLHWILARA